MALRKEAHSQLPLALVKSETDRSTTRAVYAYLAARRQEKYEQDNSYTIAQMARLIDVTAAMCSQFESGEAPSTRVALGYIEHLDNVSIPELLRQANDQAGYITSAVFDPRLDFLERLLVIDLLYRNLTGKYADKIRELVSGPCGTRTRVLIPQVQVALTTIEGNPNPSVKTHQATFNI